MRRQSLFRAVMIIVSVMMLASGVARANDCPTGGRFSTVGSLHGCHCPDGYHKVYSGLFNSKAECLVTVDIQPNPTICNISCAPPQPGCHYEGQLLSGDCSRVTCGKLVCASHRTCNESTCRGPCCQRPRICHRECVNDQCECLAD